MAKRNVSITPAPPIAEVGDAMPAPLAEMQESVTAMLRTILAVQGGVGTVKEHLAFAQQVADLAIAMGAKEDAGVLATVFRAVMELEGADGADLGGDAGAYLQKCKTTFKAPYADLFESVTDTRRRARTIVPYVASALAQQCPPKGQGLIGQALRQAGFPVGLVVWNVAMGKKYGLDVEPHRVADIPNRERFQVAKRLGMSTTQAFDYAYLDLAFRFDHLVKGTSHPRFMDISTSGVKRFDFSTVEEDDRVALPDWFVTNWEIALSNKGFDLNTPSLIVADGLHVSLYHDQTIHADILTSAGHLSFWAPEDCPVTLKLLGKRDFTGVVQKPSSESGPSMLHVRQGESVVVLYGPITLEG